MRTSIEEQELVQKEKTLVYFDNIPDFQGLQLIVHAVWCGELESAVKKRQVL